jgi:MFS family permease
MPPSQGQDTSVKVAIATAALCSCSLIHAFVLISVFPYAGYMVMLLLPHLTPETVGPYAGLIASSFMFGRSFSAYPWGWLADTVGRKSVLLASLLLSALLSLLFGLADNFAVAIILRFLLGLSNGIVGTVKTVVSELTASDSAMERRMMGMVVGMRAWGFLISPAVGGWLAEPIRQYPHLFTEDTINSTIYRVLAKYPFLLPNLFGSMLCLATALAVYYCIPETLPEDQLSSTTCPLTGSIDLLARNHKSDGESAEVSPLLPSSTKPRINTSMVDYVEHEHIDSAKKTSNTTKPSLWTKQSRDQLIPYWHFSLAVVCLDEAFPLFCIARKGGLGLSEGDIGKILSLAGLLFAASQYYIYVKTTDHLGLYSSLWIGCSLGFLPVFFIPVSLVVNENSIVASRDDINESTKLRIPTLVLLVALMAMSKNFSCVFFSSISISINKTVEANQRAALNGLATLGASVAKGAGPILAGCLVAFSFKWVEEGYQGAAIFSCIGLLGMFVVCILHQVPT